MPWKFVSVYQQVFMYHVYIRMLKKDTCIVFYASFSCNMSYHVYHGRVVFMSLLSDTGEVQGI